MQHSYNDIGSAIRKQRHRAGLTQEKLAEYSGLSVNFISKIERTEGQNISFQKLGNIADALGVDIADFFTEKDTSSENEMPPYTAMLFRQLKKLDYEDANKISKYFSQILTYFTKESANHNHP